MKYWSIFRKKIEQAASCLEIQNLSFWDLTKVVVSVFSITDSLEKLRSMLIPLPNKLGNAFTEVRGIPHCKGIWSGRWKTMYQLKFDDIILLSKIVCGVIIVCKHHYLKVNLNVEIFTKYFMTEEKKYRWSSDLPKEITYVYVWQFHKYFAEERG